MTLALAVLTGVGLGYIVERGDFCFHSTWRDMLRQPRQPDLFRAYLFLLLVSIPLVQGMIALGWIEPWIPPFVWQANLIGGLMFGVGMVVAATCITGVFYKLGHGMLGMLVALAAWAVGDILTYLGPLASLRDGLRSAEITVDGQSATLLNAPGWVGVVVLVILGIAAAAYLWRSPRQSRGKLWNWALLGGVTGLFMSVAWLLARAGGSSYTFGTSGVPSTIFVALTEQVAPDSWWIPVTLILVIPGAFIASKRAGTLWVRGETPRRYAQLAIGGLIMGIGAAIAGGCNLGHGMVGVSLLSLGSISSTVAIVVGVFVADRFFKMWQKGA
jgi:uncharacterized membrane protein YedE/YeeE